MVVVFGLVLVVVVFRFTVTFNPGIYVQQARFLEPSMCDKLTGTPEQRRASNSTSPSLDYDFKEVFSGFPL